jgi:small subunit ribosomal protein S17
MQEEKKNTSDPQADQPVAEGQDPQADQPVAENAAEEQVPPEDAPQEDAPQEDAPQEDAPQEEAPPEETPVEAPAAEGGEQPAGEPAEQLSPKQRRKQARSRATGPARAERSGEDRARERAEERARKAAARSRWRARRREKRGAARTQGEQAAAPGTRRDESAEQGARKVRQGVVVSSKGDKTITVRIDAVRRHRVYGKVVRDTDTLHAHDETNQAGEGDLVRVMECRPLSRTKRWRLVDILEKAR